MKIDDGTGKNYSQKVDEYNRALVLATVEQEFKFISEKTGEAFIWTNETYDYAAADTVLLVRNDLTNKNLHIWKIKLHGDTETEVEIHIPTAAFTIAGTAVVGEALNRVLDKNAASYATAKANETGNTQGDVIERVRIKADTDLPIEFAGAVILDADKSIGVDYVTDGGEAHVSIWGYYK